MFCPVLNGYEWKKNSFFVFFGPFYGFIDSKAEEMTGNRGRETRSKGTQAGT